MISASPTPPGAWRNKGSNPNSPVVIVMVLRSERAGVANEVRWNEAGYAQDYIKLMPIPSKSYAYSQHNNIMYMYIHYHYY